MRGTIVGALNKHRARLLQRAFESMEQRSRRLNRTDISLIAHLKKNEPSLELLGPLAGKKRCHTVVSCQTSRQDCSD